MKKLFYFVVVLMMLASFAFIPAMAEEENIALGKDVYCDTEDSSNIASLEGNAFFSSTYLTDGEAPVWDGVSQDTHICWYGGAKTQDANMTITIDLEATYALNKIVLVPTSFLEGQNMPSDFKILVSKDENEWTQVGEVTGLSGSQTENFVYETDKEARYIMISISKMSAVADANYYYAGLAEVEAYGERVAVPTNEPTEIPSETPTQAPTQAPTATPNSTDKKIDAKSDFPVVPVVIAAVAVVAVAVVIIVLVKKKKA